MGFVSKLKTVERKWIFLSLGIIIIIALCFSAVAHERFEKGDRYNNFKAYQAYYDLLQIENTGNLKLSSDQAKALLPLVQQLNKTTDEQGQADIIKNIYSSLTSQQYYSLLTDNKSSENSEKAKGGHGEKIRGNGFEGVREKSDVSGSVLESVVEKMLKDISVK